MGWFSLIGIKYLGFLWHKSGRNEPAEHSSGAPGMQQTPHHSVDSDGAGIHSKRKLPVSPHAKRQPNDEHKGAFELQDLQISTPPFPSTCRWKRYSDCKKTKSILCVAAAVAVVCSMEMSWNQEKLPRGE